MSCYLLALRFFLTKGMETTLQTTYLAMNEYGTPHAMLCDRGGQFIDPSGAGVTRFQIVLDFYGSSQLRRHFRRLGAFKTLALPQDAAVVAKKLVKPECLTTVSL